MRITTLNMWGGRVHEPLIDWLKTQDADVLCCQEVFWSPAHSDVTIATDSRTKGRAKGRNFRPNLFGEIQAVLPGYQGHFFPAMQRESVDMATGKGFLGYYGIATFVRNTIPMPISRSLFVHGEFMHIPQGQIPAPRLAHGFRVLDPVRLIWYTVVHMHGMWIPEGKDDTPERNAQAVKLLQLLESVRQPGDRLVVCGDFNVKPKSYTFKIFQGLENLVVTRGFKGTRTPLYTDNPAKKGLTEFADYMLVSPDLQRADFAVMYDPVVSDHCALVLDSK